VLGGPSRIQDRLNPITQSVVAGLSDSLPNIGAGVEHGEGRDRLWLPQAESADYRLYIHLQHRGGATLGALPRGQSFETFFWHLPFEYRREDEEQALRFLLEETRRLAANRSRILQRRGLLLWRFSCEAAVGGEWQRVGGTVACSRLASVPPSNRKVTEYNSPALV